MINNIKKSIIKTYSCDINKNKKCNKKHCICNGGECRRTTKFEYAKRTPINYIKKVLNNVV